MKEMDDFYFIFITGREEPYHSSSNEDDSNHPQGYFVQRVITSFTLE